MTPQPESPEQSRGRQSGSPADERATDQTRAAHHEQPSREAVSLDSFGDGAIRSGLLEAAVVRGLREQHAPRGALSSRKFARLLVEQGLLTRYQAERLLAGRTEGFFLGGCKILDRLGAGGMGAVYLAEQVKLGRKVAIKVMADHRKNDSDALARFLREARAVAALKHPNIVQVYDVGKEGKIHYIVMEYIAGTNLKDYLQAHGAMSVAQSTDVIRQVALGLAHAHDHQVVHRDIKPANLVLEGETVKILDLGLARKFDTDESLTTDGAGMGTPDYMSPEQFGDAHHVDIRADLYSLGCTWYHLLCGRPPFAGGTVFDKAAAHARAQSVPIDQRAPEVPATVAALIGRLMAKNPADRFQTPAELLSALDTLPAADMPVTVECTVQPREPPTIPADELPGGTGLQTPEPASSQNELTLVHAPGWSSAVVLVYALPMMAALVLGGAYFGIRAFREMGEQNPLVIQIPPAESASRKQQAPPRAKEESQVARNQAQPAQQTDALPPNSHQPDLREAAPGEEPQEPGGDTPQPPSEAALQEPAPALEPRAPQTWLVRSAEEFDHALGAAATGDVIELEPGKQHRLPPRALEGKQLTLRSSKGRQHAALVFELPAGTEKPEAILQLVNAALRCERIDAWFSVPRKATDENPVALFALQASDLVMTECSVTIDRGTVESASPVTLALVKTDRPWDPSAGGAAPRAIQVELRDCLVRGVHAVGEARGRQLRLVVDNSILCGPREVLRVFQTNPLEFEHQKLTVEIASSVVDVAGPMIAIECRPYALVPPPLQVVVRSSLLCNSRAAAAADLPPQISWQSPVEDTVVTTALRWQGERNGYLQRADGLRMKTAAGPVAVLVQSPDEWQRVELGAESDWKFLGPTMRLPRTPWQQRTAADYRPARQLGVDLDRLKDPPRQPPKR